MKGAVFYRNCWLTRGSHALELHEAMMGARPDKRNAAREALHRHLKELDEKQKRLGDVAPLCRQGKI